MRTALLLFSGLLISGMASAQSEDLTQAQAEAKITAAGYTNVRNLQRDDGFWEADASRAGRTDVDVRVYPKTGKVYADGNRIKLNARAIRKQLEAAGYTRVRDIELDDGVWSVDAHTAAGNKVDLAVDPDDGKVLVETPDRDD